MNPRLTRLRKDYENLLDLEARSSFVAIEQAEGDPPYEYRILLSCTGIRKLDAEGHPILSERHELHIKLPSTYPRKGPRFRMRTPVFHPNIGQGGSVCIGDEGDHGFAPSMRLDDLVVRIIRIIRYENIGLNSPFNGIARDWARQNTSRFPLDTRQIRGKELPGLLDEIEILDPEQDANDLGIVVY